MEEQMSPEGNQKQPESIVKKYALFVWEIVKILVIAAIIVLPIRYFIFQPFIVKGDSMVPNFHSSDYLIVDEITYRLIGPKRGDVVVFKYPLDNTQRFIKRVIGLPGETVDIKNGVVTISKDEKTIVLNERGYIPSTSVTDSNVHMLLGEGKYFVMGDNRPFSYDSRRWGVLPKEDIIGRALIRIFPLSDISYIAPPNY
jgi:signal peptidase I